MRITNKIMQNNSLSNINMAKVYEDSLSSQVSSGKQIVRPSDDPIIAIRALRLRSSVVEITQYYSRNAKDAEAWLNTTEDAMQQVSDVLTDMVKQYDKGANEDLTSKDRNIILEQLKALQKEVYATGDADYAGRYVFTGYRTESSLMFAKDTNKLYEITEQFMAGDLKSGTYVNTFYEDNGNDRDLKDLQEGTQPDYANVREEDITVHEYHRIRLAYDKCGEDELPVIQKFDAKGNLVPATFMQGGTTETDINTVRETAKSTDLPSPYKEISNKPDAVIYLADTGELLLGDNVYKSLSGMVDDPLTRDVNEGEFVVTYQKSEFKDGDLKPEHYFACTAAGADNMLGGKDDIVYNENYLDPTHERQVIEYDVGYNQRMQVNTIAEECFDHDIVREVNDMVRLLEDIQKIEDVTTTLKGMLDKTTDEAARKILQNQLNTAKKAYTYEREAVQKKFESDITVIQGFLDKVNVAVTDCGARGSRLELVTSRLCSQKTTFETLKSENEDVDLSEAIVKLTSAEMTYEAALKATGKIMQTNLMDFI